MITILLFISAILHSHSLEPDIKPIVHEIVAEHEYSYIFNKSTEYVLVVTNLTQNFGTVPPRIHVECLDCEKSNPALIIIKQKRGVTSLQLPFIVKLLNGEEISYNKTARTICSYEKYTPCVNTLDTHVNSNNCSGGEISCKLIITLSTLSNKNVKVTLEVTLVTDFVLKSNEINKTIHLTPSTSQLYLYEFPTDRNNGSVQLTVLSDESNCMMISIRNKSCLYVDHPELPYNGYYQTVTHQGAVTITDDYFPLGFYAIFLLFPDDSYCGLSSSSSSSKFDERSKTINISVYDMVPTDYYVYAVIKTVCFIMGFYVLILSVTFFYFMRKNIEVPNLDDEEVFDVEDPSTSAGRRMVRRAAKPQDVLSPGTENDTLSFVTDSSLEETDFDLLMEAQDDKDKIRTKAVLYVSDLAKKNPTILKKKSDLYFWNLLTIAIFYGLPASQYVFSYQYNLFEYGNQDLCYYNFLCSHPWGVISDFNHFFSNIGYICFGCLFLIVTLRKEQVHKILLSQCKRLNRQYGVPQHFGLFYAMGVALIFEGILSSCYHLCPNIYIFQFDASFMYVIGTLCMIKIYHSRHPDVSATAYSTFFILAGVIFLEICGIFVGGPIFWGVLTLLHFTTSFNLSMQIYYVGRFGFGVMALKKFFEEFRLSARYFVPMYPARFILIVIINICNWALAIAALVIGVKDVASYLLLIFIVNLMLYTMFYLIMKLISQERILLQPLVYMVLAVASWSAALYYFFHKTISWKKTPAESRLLNQKCQLFGFYDNHDIWHFISSMGLFFSFMVLLTLDDDLIFTHRSRILVF